MAQKRMFSKKITDSDAFLEMPLSAQCLYFHLNMNADDDGFVNAPKKVMRMIGASVDDYKLLVAKAFVLEFESGIIVIKHWRMHNTLQSDRHVPTDYQDEMSQLVMKENKSYTLKAKLEMFPKCFQNVSIDKVKNRLDLDIDIDKSIYLSDDEKQKIYEVAKSYVPNLTDRQTQLFYKLGKTYGLDLLIETMDKVASRSDVVDFISYVKTSLNGKEKLNGDVGNN